MNNIIDQNTRKCARDLNPVQILTRQCCKRSKVNTNYLRQQEAKLSWIAWVGLLMVDDYSD